jgi:hypothetical protein
MVSADHVGSPSRTHYRVVHVQMLMQLLCLTDESRQSHTLLVEPAVAQLLSETRRNSPSSSSTHLVDPIKLVSEMVVEHVHPVRQRVPLPVFQRSELLGHRGRACCRYGAEGCGGDATGGQSGQKSEHDGDKQESKRPGLKARSLTSCGYRRGCMIRSAWMVLHAKVKKLSTLSALDCIYPFG